MKLEYHYAYACRKLMHYELDRKADLWLEGRNNDDLRSNEQ